MPVLFTQRVGRTYPDCLTAMGDESSPSCCTFA
jgi:hypothetical protein